MARTKVHAKAGTKAEATKKATVRRSKTAETLAVIEKEAAYEAKLAARRARSDSQILAEQKHRFELFGIAFDALIDGDIRSLIASGAPGIGKSFLAYHRLKAAYEQRQHKHEISKGGGLSQINLYMMGWDLRHGGTMLIDDADDVFDDLSTLNMLKALTDTGAERVVSYRKEAQALLNADIPKEYLFNGGVAFLTNKNLDEAIELGRGSHVVHYEALLSRGLYLDLRIHDRRDIAVWVAHIVSTTALLQNEGIHDKATRDAIMKWIMDKEVYMNLRNLDLRTPVKVAHAYKMVKGKNWQSAAKEFLCRD